MKHHVRQRVINEFGLPVTKVATVHGELGSGIFDKNGVEIFEGDRVSAPAEMVSEAIGDTEAIGIVLCTTSAQWMVSFERVAVELYKIAADLEVVGYDHV